MVNSPRSLASTSEPGVVCAQRARQATLPAQSLEARNSAAGGSGAALLCQGCVCPAGLCPCSAPSCSTSSSKGSGVRPGLFWHRAELRGREAGSVPRKPGSARGSEGATCRRSALAPCCHTSACSGVGRRARWGQQQQNLPGTTAPGGRLQAEAAACAKYRARVLAHLREQAI